MNTHPGHRGVRRRQVLATGLAALTPRLDRRSSTTPAAYTPIAELPLRGAKEAVVTPDNDYTVVAVTNGYAIVDCTTPESPSIATENRRVLDDHPDGPLQDIYDVAVDDTTLAVAGPAHDPTDNRLAAVAAYDITDPTNPSRVMVHETNYPIHNCHIADDTVYLTANTGTDNPLVTVDVPTGDELGRWSVIDADPAWNDVPPILRTIHDVTVHDTTAVLSQWDAGTWLLDVTDPAAPTTLANVTHHTPTELSAFQDDDAAIDREYTALPGNAHYATLDDDATILGIGREAWDTDPTDDHDGGPGGIDLYDSTDPTTLTSLAHIAPPPTPDPTYSGLWTTAHNFELTNDRLYASWYRGGVTIHDLTDPTTPERIAWWRNPDTTSFWTARRGDDWVAATSFRDPPQPIGRGAGLYLFPDRAGTQPTPPTLTPTTSTTTTTLSTTTTATTTTPSPTTATTTTTTTTETTSTPGQPGFGVLTVGAAAAYAAYRYFTHD